jgi:hypothetical protein
MKMKKAKMAPAKPEKKEVVKDPKSFSKVNAKKNEPDVYPTSKRPAGKFEKLRNVRI